MPYFPPIVTGGVSIGSVIGGGPVDGRALFVGTGGVLAQDSAFTFDQTDKQLIMGAGTAPLPSIALVDKTMGFYRVAANALGVATAGVGRWQFDASGGIRPIAHNVYDIGATAIAPRTIYAATDIYCPAYRISAGGTSVFVMAVSAGFCNHNASGSGGSCWGFNFSVGGTVATSGARPFFQMTPPANTGQTASTEIRSFSIGASSRQWATGALAIQREWAFLAQTYSFVAASVITKAVGAYFQAPIAGANATLTDRYSIETDSNLLMGGFVEGTEQAAPAAPAANGWRLFAQDNGAGKTQLMVIFATGAAQQVAIQP